MYFPLQQWNKKKSAERKNQRFNHLESNYVLTTSVCPIKAWHEYIRALQTILHNRDTHIFTSCCLATYLKTTGYASFVGSVIIPSNQLKQGLTSHKCNYKTNIESAVIVPVPGVFLEHEDHAAAVMAFDQNF